MQAAQDLDYLTEENFKTSHILEKPAEKAIPAPAEIADAPVLQLFEYSLQISLAERYPRLMCVAIAFCLLATALILEIECLRVSGYYWP